MSVDGASDNEGGPVSISDIPQAQRQDMGNRWVAMDNQSGKTLEEKVADLKSRQENGQVDQVARQAAEEEVKMIKDPQYALEVRIEKMRQEAAEKTAKLKQEIDTITEDQDAENVMRQLGERMDQYHNEQTQMAISAMRERLDQLPAPLPKEVASIAITDLGKYAAIEMNSDTERDHMKVRENRRQAGNVITTTALRSEDPALMEEAVNQLAKGLTLGDLGIGANHALIIDRIQTLAQASADPQVEAAAVKHLDAYASLEPHPGHRNFHMGYLGSSAFEPVQKQAESVIRTLRPSPDQAA